MTLCRTREPFEEPFKNHDSSESTGLVSFVSCCVSSDGHYPSIAHWRKKKARKGEVMGVEDVRRREGG